PRSSPLRRRLLRVASTGSTAAHPFVSSMLCSRPELTCSNISRAAHSASPAATAFGARHVLTDRGAVVPAFDRVEVPLLHDVPVLGPAQFGQTALGYGCVAVVVVTALLLGPRTAPGGRPRRRSPSSTPSAPGCRTSPPRSSCWSGPGPDRGGRNRGGPVGVTLSRRSP